jgi:hypothetical protein
MSRRNLLGAAGLLRRDMAQLTTWLKRHLGAAQKSLSERAS